MSLQLPIASDFPDGFATPSLLAERKIGVDDFMREVEGFSGGFFWEFLEDFRGFLEFLRDL